jgi:hypothetical protein
MQAPARSDWKPNCPACGWFQPTNALPVVVVVARAPSGRILYTRRRDWPDGAWGLEETGLHGRSPRLMRTIVDRDRLLIAVAADIDDDEPRAGTDVDEVLLAAPDPALVPANWPVRQLVEDLRPD